MVFLGWGAVSYERGTPVNPNPYTLKSSTLQGYLAHKQQRPPRTLGGWLFRMSEVPLSTLNPPQILNPTGVPCSEETAPPYDPTVGLCIGPYGVPRSIVPYGGPRGGGCFL